MSTRIGSGPSGLSLVASTPGLTGFTKVNGTPTLFTWNVPNDGNIHRFLLLFSEWVTTAETGGQMQISGTMPNGQVANVVFLAGQAVGQHQTSINLQVQPGTAVTLTQNTALTLGASVCWAELWAL